MPRRRVEENLPAGRWLATASYPENGHGQTYLRFIWLGSTRMREERTAGGRAGVEDWRGYSRFPASERGSRR